MASKAYFFLLDALIYLRHPRLIVSFLRNVGYLPRPSLPTRYNERYLWRKLFDHDPRFTESIDKIRVKERISRLHPEIRVPKTLWEGEDSDDIPEALLAGDCVIKANHGCGWNVFVRDGKVDRAELRRKTRKWMSRRYYGRGRMEWGYRDIEPRLFAEEMVMADGRPVDREYKCYVAAGDFIYAFVKVDRFGAEPKDIVLDRDGMYRITIVDRSTETVPFDKPKNWDRIVAAASRLGEEFDLVRCDLYEIDGEIWFSEFTFYSLSGYCSVGAPDINERLDDAWDIRRSWFMATPQAGWRGRYKKRLKAALDAEAGSQPA